MGEPKQLLRVGGESLVRRAAEAVLAAGCAETFVVLGANAPLIQRELEDVAARIVINDSWREGMSASLRGGIEAVEKLSSAADAALITLCDQPFVGARTLARLIESYRATNAPVVASAYSDARGVPALFDRALFAELKSLRGEAGARQIIARHANEAAFVEAPEAGFDLDTAEDFNALCERFNATAL